MLHFVVGLPICPQRVIVKYCDNSMILRPLVSLVQLIIKHVYFDSGKDQTELMTCGYSKRGIDTACPAGGASQSRGQNKPACRQ